MPIIEGLEEQKAALKRVKEYLTELENINEFIDNLLKFSKETDNVKYIIEVAFKLNDDENRRLRNPIIVPDNNYILECVLKYKESIAEKTKKDALEHNITLTPQDLVVLNCKLDSE